MAHQRTTIIGALVSLLTGATDAESRVYSNRTAEIPNSKLPALNIVTRSESAEPVDTMSSRYYRTLVVDVEIRAEANTDVADALDEICDDVESTINANRTLSGTASGGCVYKSMEQTIDDTGGEKPTGKMILTYEIKYLYTN
jgi:hypothetical protein